MTRYAASSLSRRRFLQAASIVAALPASTPAWPDAFVELALPGGPERRSITTAFPQKGRMVLQRSRPPLLETPFDVFDRGVFTPNDRILRALALGCHSQPRWTSNAFRLAVRGHVNERAVAVDAGHSRNAARRDGGRQSVLRQFPRAFSTARARRQWGNGAMGNARWTGVRLRDVLDRAGVKSGAVAVRFKGLDEPVSRRRPNS